MIARYLILFFALIATAAQAATYDMTAGQYPPCNTSWNVTGTTYTCTGNGRVTLENSDLLTANSTITIVADNGFSLNNNVIGSPANNINLQSSYGTVVSAGSNTVYGNIIADGGNITLSNTQISGGITTDGHIVLTGGSVGGQVTSTSNTITLSNTQVSGAIAANGHIVLTGGSVGGRVTSTSNTITANGTDLGDGAQAHSGMNIAGGVITGSFVMTSSNQATFSGVTMTDGSITGAGTVNITGNSTLGSGGSAIIISSNSGPITVTNGSTVYGNLTAPNWSTIHVNNGGAVYGICTPGSTPANACNEAPQGVAYYVLSHSANGVTCEAEPITITAYNAEDEVVAPPAGTVLGLSTSPNTGVWVGGDTDTFSGSETSVIRYLRQTSSATLVLNAGDGSASAESTQISFTDTALRFYGLPELPQSMVAGDDYVGVTLRAVQTNTDTGACEARVEGEQVVQLAYECRNPTMCSGGQSFTVNDEYGMAANGNDMVSAYANVPLTFDASGTAPFDLNFTDVGLVRLHGILQLQPEGNDPAATLAGSSSEFVVKPHRLVVFDVSVASDAENCELGFVTAGENFSVTVEAHNANGVVTPNFVNDAWGYVSLEIDELVYPEDGYEGLLTGVDEGSFSASGINTSVSWNEVGSIALRPESSDYLGAGGVQGNTSDPVGYFCPHHFSLTGSSVANSCDNGGFTYMDEPGIEISYTLEARTKGGDRTLNYDNAGTYEENYAGTATVSYVAENNNSGDNLGDRLQVQEGFWKEGKWVNDAEDDEEGKFNTEEAAFERDVEEGPDGPFYDLQLGIAVEGDPDGAVLIGLNMNPTTPPENSTTTLENCADDNSCTAKVLGDPLDLRYGRLNLASAYGPEVLDLPVPFTVDYYNGVRWQRNALDTCTIIPRDTVQYPAGPIDNDANRTVNLGGGSTTGEYGAISATDISFTSGQVDHFFTAPGVAGEFEVTIDLGEEPWEIWDKPWLQFDWDNDGEVDSEVTGKYEFGSYRGHDRIIYWREVFN